jgi:hypothetical protein
VRLWLALWSLLGCVAEPEANFEFPEADARPALRGGGGPAVHFAPEELLVACAELDAGEEDVFHHRNLVMPYRGHLVMPWAPEWGRGGLVFFDVSDPCSPVTVGTSVADEMRETHAIGFVHLPGSDPNAGDYAVVNARTGAMFWDVSDPSAPVAIARVDFEGVFYPDAYARVPLAVFWQYPYVYAAVADNGVFVVDATNPYAPVQIGHYVFDPGLRVGGVFAIGNELLVTAAKEVEQAILDVSQPSRPTLFPNGRFVLYDSEGVAVEPYHGNLVGDYALFARKSDGGGPIVYDVSDPSMPVLEGEYKNPDGSGGYLFYDEGFIFQGESNFGGIYDARDMTGIQPVGRGDMEGDVDTFVPYGNVGVLSVDDEAAGGVGTVVIPWAEAPDGTGPLVLRMVPADGATGVGLSAPLGVGFDEFVEPSSVFAGSIRLFDEEGVAVDGWGSAQEATANYVPKSPLAPMTTYRFEVLEGGVTDLNGNPTVETVSVEFTTGSR